MENLFVVEYSYKDKFLGPFVYDSPAPGVDGGNSLSQNMEKA